MKHKVEVLVDGRQQACLYAEDFSIVTDNDEIELHASVYPIPTKGIKQ